jgi:feruloyl-CoA synthase
VQDVVVTGLNRDALGLLLFPRLDECRRLAGLDASASSEQVLSHPSIEAFLADLLERLRAMATGGATRPAWLHVLREPPSIDRGEITDKGSINQRAVLAHRAELVEALYAKASATTTTRPETDA